MFGVYLRYKNKLVQILFYNFQQREILSQQKTPLMKNGLKLSAYKYEYSKVFFFEAKSCFSIVQN